MELYHFSNGNYEILTPQYGKGRNEGEDSRVRGKPCVFFTNKKKMVSGQIYSYFYVVEVDENDLDLIEDETMIELMNQVKGEERWYAYMKEIEPREIYKQNNGIFERIK